MSLSYSDLRNEYNLNDYTENVEQLQISNSLPIDPDVVPIVMLPELVPVIEPVLNGPPINKRKNVTITQYQIDKLKELYLKYGSGWSALQYSSSTGIILGNCSGLLCKLRKNINIDKSTVKKGRRRIISKETAVKLSELLAVNSKLTLKKMRVECARIDRLLSNLPAATDEIELYNEGPDESTIHSLLTDKNNDYGLPLYSFKRLSSRAVDSNSPENKSYRIVVIDHLRRIGSGNIIVYVDEANWQVGFIRGNNKNILVGCGWAEVGEKAFGYSRNSSRTITSIASISDKFGVGITDLIEGYVTSAVFIAYVKRMINYYVGKKQEINSDQVIVFFMDNASIHHHEEVKSIVEEANCLLIYNAPYSAEANPIEMVFGFWKLRCENELAVCGSFPEFLNVISRHFFTLGNREVSNTIMDVQSRIWQKIYDKLDL